MCAVSDHADMKRSDETLERATYSVDEVAQILGIARTTAYESIHRGEIPAFRFGRRIVVLRHSLDSLLSAPREHLPLQTAARSASS